MKSKVKILLLVVIIMASIISIKPFVYGDSLNFIDVKVASVSIKENTTLSSSTGFYLFEKNDKENVIEEILESEILIEIDDEENMVILNLLKEPIFTIDKEDIIIASRDLLEPMIKVNKNRFRDYIYFLKQGEYINILNHIEIDNYLYGVVPREIPASSSHEALKAQAVVARSFAYCNVNKHIGEGYNLCNTTHCQVYGGVDGEHINTTKAVDDTIGEYVAYNGKVVSTPYHSNSGGYTEDSGKVWNSSLPYLQSVIDSYSDNAPYSSWNMDLSPREIESKLQNGGVNIGSILDIKIEETTNSRRVAKVRIIGSEREEIISGDKFRSLLGTTNLKSTLFDIEKNGMENSKKVYIIDKYSDKAIEKELKRIFIINKSQNSVVNRSSINRVLGNGKALDIDEGYSSAISTFILKGRGYGHGVGMSQYGAIEMAKRGYSYEDIIKHYYKGVEIINLGK